MRKQLILFIVLLFIAAAGIAQQMPVGSCGIVVTYDASGNRLKRVYFCNNGVNPYPTRVAQQTVALNETKETEEYIAVDALFPNPTTGKFSITFSKALNNAQVLLTDNNGKTVQQFKGNGNRLEFDLSSLPGGVYFVRIIDGNIVITKKVVKQ